MTLRSVLGATGRGQSEIRPGMTEGSLTSNPSRPSPSVVCSPTTRVWGMEGLTGRLWDWGVRKRQKTHGRRVYAGRTLV